VIKRARINKFFFDKKKFIQISNLNILTNNKINRKLFFLSKTTIKLLLLSKELPLNLDSKHYKMKHRKFNASFLIDKNFKSRIFLNFLHLNKFHNTFTNIKYNYNIKNIKSYFFSKIKNKTKRTSYFIKNRTSFTTF